MYQRYIANPDGTFRKTVVDEPPRPMPPPPPEPVCAPPPPRPELACPPERPRPPEPGCPPKPLSLRGLLPETLDVGDLLLALILLLLYLDSEDEDPKLRGGGKWVRAVR